MVPGMHGPTLQSESVAQNRFADDDFRIMRNNIKFALPKGEFTVKRTGLLILAFIMVLAVGTVFAEVSETDAKPRMTDIERVMNLFLTGENPDYSISTLEYGPLASHTVDAAPFAGALLNGAIYTESQEEVPDGEYAVLNLWDEQLRFDFFFADGKQNIIREIADDRETLYQVSFENDTHATAIVSSWVDALAKALNADTEWVSDEDVPEMKGELVDGRYVIRVNLKPEDTGVWRAGDPQDGSAVRLVSTEMKNGQMTAVYEAVGDGSATVSIRHCHGSICDALHTFDLLVRDGSIQEETGGSYTASPADEELDEFLAGEWREAETQFTVMNIKRRPERGFNIEIESPMTHGAYRFGASAYYDCEQDCLVYENGTFYDIMPTEDADQAPSLERTKGTLSFESEDGVQLQIVWSDATRPDEAVRFERE